jgi:hypothetical protein
MSRNWSEKTEPKKRNAYASFDWRKKQPTGRKIHPAMGTLKEAAAGSLVLAAAKRDPNSNELIKAAIADFETSSEGSVLAMRERFAQAEPAECVQRSLASLQEVSAIVDAKAPDEAAAFKTWLREISQKVAEAAVEGSFLGFGGVRVSDAETATLRDISKALGTAS